MALAQGGGGLTVDHRARARPTSIGAGDRKSGQGARSVGPITIHPGTVGGTVRVPGSKSVTHRAYVLAARSDRPVTVADPLRAADPDATLACLHRLGARVHLEQRAVRFDPATWQPPADPLDCRNAGTGLRLLTAQAAIERFPVVLTGDASLRTRPNGPLLDALRRLGAAVDGDRDGRCPYRVEGPMQAGDVRLPPKSSSQFASALLVSLPLLEGPSTVRLDAPVQSRPYLDVTLRTLSDFGVAVHDADASSEGRLFSAAGGAVPRAGVVHVPADWSTAAFPLAAAAVTGGKIHVQGPRADDPQGDRAIATLLADFGADVRTGDDAVTVEGGPLESPGTIDVAATPDLFPALCAVAACARGTTTFIGGDALRHKESDRIAAMAAGLDAMGIDVRERPDGLVVEGLGSSRPRGAQLASRGDHRIHMALAVLALAADGPSTIDEPGCVDVSYPSFHDALAGLQEAA